MKHPFLGVAIAAMLCVGMWMYVGRVIVPEQKAYAAVHGNPRGNLSDLYPRWFGSRELVLRRRDPYSAEITREIQIGYYGRPLDASRPNDPLDQESFAYPVYVAFLLAPTIRLPFPVVQEIFRWALAGFTVLSIALWLKFVKWEPGAVGTAVVTILTLGSFWVVQGIRLQQLTLLVAPMIAGSVYLLVKDRSVFSGILLGLATIKPQIALPLAAWLILWACARISVRWKWVAAFATTVFALAIAGEFLLPGWVPEFYVALIAYRNYTRHLSPLDELATPALGIPLAVLVVAVVAWICRRARKFQASEDLFVWTTALVLAANLLVIPSVAPYNQLLLLPAIFLLLRARRELGASRVPRFLAWVAVGTLAWPATAATVLSLLSLLTPAVQRFWEVPLWTSILIPIPIAACVGLRLREISATETS